MTKSIYTLIYSDIFGLFSAGCALGLVIGLLVSLLTSKLIFILLILFGITNFTISFMKTKYLLLK